MTDKDVNQVQEPKAEEPKAEEPKAEEPKTEKPQPETGTGEATPAGTDQYGRQLYSVTCASCGKQTQVPFKPSGGRPVYCRDCYMKQRRERSGGFGRGPRR